MLPTLFIIGPFSLKTLNLFLVLAFFASGFVFWRFGKEEHYREDQLFDGFLLSFITGLLAARLAYVLTHLASYSWNVIVWLDVWSDPQFNLFAGLIGAIAFMITFTKKQKWDQFAILDLWLPAIMFGAAVIQIGLFFDRQAPGILGASSWWASKHFLLAIIFSLFTWYSRFVELKYRTYSWYRRRHQVAQTGFVFGLGLSLMGFGLLLTELLVGINNLSTIKLSNYLGGAGLIVVGSMVLFIRAGFFDSMLKRSKKV